MRGRAGQTDLAPRQRFKLACVTGWQPDVLPGYWQLTIPLGDDPDGEGDIDATLLRCRDAAPATDAVLAVH